MSGCETPINLGVFTVGEKPAPLQYSYTDFDGNVINLTGYTATFQWQPVGDPAQVGAATVVTPLTGTVEHAWMGTEFLTPGQHVAQFWVGNGTNRWASVKIRWTVQGGVGGVPAI
jgi:hypothetical protein